MNDEFEIENEDVENEDLNGFGFDERFDIDGCKMGDLDDFGFGSIDDLAENGGIDFG